MRKLFWWGLIVVSFWIVNIKYTEAIIGTSQCGWCGLSCTRLSSDMACVMIAPPEGKMCVEENGSCVIKVVPEPTIGNCVPRPSCLDTVPRCMLAEPADGWCPITVIMSPTPPMGCYYKQVQCIVAPCYPTLVCATPTPRRTVGEGEMCGGIAGILCSAGLTCKYNAIGGDQSGVCTNLVRVTPTTVVLIMGDANGDGKVDLVDFTLWKKDYLFFANNLPEGNVKTDFNQNGVVDLVDFTIWKREYLKLVVLTPNRNVPFSTK